eukprot:TRINITY_DN6706_c0_g2_i1.p1 TRINITY_DN6706_c0_g2~~TRINITY_DN6706_c0_g2_i1.p1  ORF type:complete len:580 (+),score=87.23 TRINITY_DN6706_c0_g2_i1:45-1742(+)
MRPTRILLTVRKNDRIKHQHGGVNLQGAEGRFFITTAINYTNGKPHVGHAYEAVLADVFARFYRVAGKEVFFLTGSDEHGQKIANRANETGMDPKEYCDVFTEMFQKLNTHLNITHDFYIRTTDEIHKQCCRKLWEACTKSGDIYLSTYDGWYNEKEETFVPQQEAELLGYKDPATGADLKPVTEECYFFRLSKYQTRLVKHILADENFIKPSQSRNQVLEMLKKPLKDLCISRTAFSWGIPTPSGTEHGHVMYVWFDALTNYLSATGGCTQQNPWWPADMHVVGKDITRFHCIYWPAMLWSAGLDLPKTVYSHGFVCDSTGKKMSKSIGNVVCPQHLINSYPVDTLRFYLCHESGSDVKFSESCLIDSHNQVLADTIGNLSQRGATLCERFCCGVVPSVEVVEGCALPFDADAAFSAIQSHFEARDLRSALSVVLQCCRDANKWLTDAAPWLPCNEPHRDVTVFLLLEALYILAHFFSPFLPITSAAIFDRLSTPGVSFPALLAGKWNHLKPVALQKGGWSSNDAKTLFPKFTQTREEEPPVTENKKSQGSGKKKKKLQKVTAI